MIKAAKGLGTFPLPKIDAAVYEFWAFKESVGDAPTLPAVALQIHALKTYPAWHSLLEQLHVGDLHGLPLAVNGDVRATEMRTLMRTLRSVFVSDPSAADKVGQLIARPSTQQPPEERRVLQALLGMYAGNPHRVLNFYGPPGTIRTIPYQAVIKGDTTGLGKDALDFRGKTVFVGFSDLYDPGHPDRFFTVFTNEDGVDLSGVEIAATAFGNLLTDASVKPVGNFQAIGLLFFFGLIIGTLAYLIPALVGVPLAIALAAAYGT